jgi:NTP pyrophosphatase (non-canonical NTP hydrolase)
MQPQEYQEFTRSTAIYSKQIEREYLVLGLMSEAVELLQLMSFESIPNDVGRWLPASKEEFQKEAGDCFWYVARLCDTFDLEFSLIVDFAIDFIERSHVKSFRPKEDVDEVIKQSGDLCGIQKKVFRDNDGVWSEEKIDNVEPILRLVVLNLIRLLHTYGSNLESCLQANCDKLCDRKDRGVLAGSGDNR